MKFLYFLTRPFHIEIIQKIGNAVRRFPITEKVIFFLALVVCLVSASLLIFSVNQNLQVEVPSRGGILREGIVGTPRFINPILAISDADQDMTALVYAGLTRAMPDGTYKETLAESYTISEDGKTYTFRLKDNLVFHDGEPLTTEDVAFTIQMAQDTLLRSPKRAHWEGVSVVILSDRDIQFTLSEPFEPFIENTTLGILPKHIWQGISVDQFQFSRFNVDPVGAGPYRVRSVRYNSGGLPVHYELSPFANYALGEVYIDRIIVRLYQDNEQLIESFNKNNIDTVHGFSLREYNNISSKEGNTVYKTLLPRVFGVFFNQNESPALLNNEVRLALSESLDRQAIVQEVFGDFAKAIDTAIPSFSKEISNYSIDTARGRLENANWEINEGTGIYERETDEGIERLSFSISTANNPELIQTAELIEKQWEALNADVTLQIFNTNDLNQNVIRPRDYQTLLFGIVLGRNTHLYPFWHSSGRNDPGLNIAQYTNITVDKLVENARVISDTTQRQELFSSFIQEIETDIPAVFIYSPYFTYIIPNKVQNVAIDNMVVSSDRFNNVHEWYIETEKVWKIFVD